MARKMIYCDDRYEAERIRALTSVCTWGFAPAPARHTSFKHYSPCRLHERSIGLKAKQYELLCDGPENVMHRRRMRGELLDMPLWRKRIRSCM
jgi:hypothetical protein